MLCRMSATPTGPRPSPLPSPPLWRSRDYLLWFTGDTLADFGSSLRAFAMPLIAYAATGSLTTAGLVGTVGAVASTVMTVPGGVVVDRVDRKRLIVLGDLARATIYGSAALAWRLGALTPPVLLVVAAASGACAGVFGLASNAMIKHVVPPDRYPSAQAANQARESALSIASNPAGGALMSVSPAAPFLAEAAGHVLAAVSIWRVRADTRPGAESASPPDPARPGGRGPVAGARRACAEVVEGWRWLAGRPFLLFLSLVFGLLSISGTGSYTAVVLGWSHDGLSAARIGVLTTGSGVAMLVGAAGATRLSRRVRGGVLLLAATAVTVSATAGLALVPSVLGRALLLALLFCAAPIMNAVGGRLRDAAHPHRDVRPGRRRPPAHQPRPARRGPLAGGARARRGGAQRDPVGLHRAGGPRPGTHAGLPAAAGPGPGLAVGGGRRGAMTRATAGRG